MVNKLIISFTHLLLIAGCSNIELEFSKVEIINFRSDIFQNDRKVRVYLPKGYSEKKTYKVLYLNDGQNIFENDSQKKSEYWHVDKVADSLIQNNLIEPIIIVGIDNIGSKQRGNEYLPWEDIYLHPPIPDPQGKKYPKFLTNELMPFINKQYRTKEGVEHTGLGGFSYGGLISIYTAVVTNQFSKLLIESPSLYVNEQMILKEAANNDISWPEFVYVGIGTNELNIENCDETNEDNLMAVNDVKTLLDIIRRQSQNSEIHYEETPCGIHSFEEASKRLPMALKFLYGNKDVGSK